VADSLSNWLALREPADIASRIAASGALAALQPFVRALAARASSDRAMRILDLAAGTGSNFRFLAGRLPADQEWLLVDHDPVLLAEVPSRVRSWAHANSYDASVEGPRTVVRGRGRVFVVETRQLNLENPAALDIFAGRHLVTASALLDLVSESWLHALASNLHANGAAALFTLSYDGTSRCAPVEPEDDWVLELFNRHQGRDKGLGGPAAGPRAVAAAARAFAAVGYPLQREDSDWVLTPDQTELQRQLIEGWAAASTETAPESAGTIASWLARRLEHVRAGRSHVTVGHEDIAAWPLTL